MLFRQSFLSHHIIRRAIMTSSYTPIAIQHVNLAIPKGTLEQAQEFYGDVIGFKNDQVPQLQRGTILWFRVGDGPQQIHVSFEKGSTETGPALSDPSPISSRHPCFSLPSQEALTALQERIYEHHIKGVPASAQECDKPGGENSGSKGVEFPTRFFARDFAGNRLEFSV
ncbi:hypothetical protein CNAG_02043 [Cryptococcus neoformans var. grubii H99]|uniref:VOC domain-containing protein n=1 Tax=Cryptococcus neoformans (strain H99 / ATCC 208821 / CBS 10515 / FGSC 9487) TaxID=235443 RepID=J9VQT8_CRYN9|nr:hypothetical protein CNAG_02043 [Cryptococcus neoformans var. grubii H99]AFR95776.2 hypothetical protein CNAG_02043 [Cryptococcus neoformans var. grubii H99]AUB25619.1 hypothetical protein CKF44_02043 [Cryptococcus neoformans var. grubii]|eukprot:XP_012049869.1 hypothetical protein CNAG_02043 [Cryptococcus neoformans var. grubii H99]